MPQVSYQMDQDAQQAASLTGLSKKVIEAQWVAENGWAVPSGYNFGNIRYYSAYSGASYYHGANPNSLLQDGSFVQYGSDAAGVRAYSQFLSQNSNYQGIMATAGKSDQQQLQAIVESPWDSGHYTQATRGDKLFGAYQSITGIATSYDPTMQTILDSGSSSAQGSNTGNVGIIAQLAHWEQFQSLSDWEAQNKRGGLTDPAAAFDWMGAQAPAAGIAIVCVLLGLILVVFGLIQSVKN